MAQRFILKYSLPLAITWAFIILGLCSMPGQYVPSFSFLELLSFDKWVHAGIFFTLCCLLFFYWMQKTEQKKPIYIFLLLILRLLLVGLCLLKFKLRNYGNQLVSVGLEYDRV